MKFLWVLILLVPALVQGAEQIVECPVSLDVKSTASAPSGWQLAESPEPHVLDHIGLFRGNPADQESLVPESTDQQGRAKDVWKFDATEKMWAACFYTGTSLFVAKPLKQGVTRCEALYGSAHKGAQSSLIAARCQ
ncbi:STY0301 family protein [Dyella choica]|uniref:Uncharacterized protein n=1 Tax=Dyella choica TaxID=1927959 RepID=A0A3S0RLW7_9GAMM|nr:STY0301 family protein [Dyella choica]RUL77696.1 hypothetical protein EKH80_07445 [Dyella choica]